MSEQKIKTTTVNLIDGIYIEFKSRSVRDGFTLQKLVNRAVYKYIHDEEFRDALFNMTDLEATGSNF